VQALAKELVALEPDMIFVQGTPLTAALHRESRAIPIVFVNVSDPIGSGFIASLARPSGNLTGLLLYEPGIMGKWLAMLKEIAPRIARVALIGSPKTTAYDYFLRAGEALASSLAIELVSSRVENAADIEHSIQSFARAPTVPRPAVIARIRKNYDHCGTLQLGGVGGAACVPPPGRGECVDTILGHGLWPAKSVPARGAKLVGGPLRNNVVIPQ
jgi:ABC transporter substrate binding protein